ncbi:hypothetical protein GCM10023195_31070 [Actinoallomurus liliacearum]|uniref:Uncharacterized protein n=1 Tax=Actinoallomurus liliacearum TaxID=1080073 RepID=A0ABP8TIY4_9ACTN
MAKPNLGKSGVQRPTALDSAQQQARQATRSTERGLATHRADIQDGAKKLGDHLRS